MAALEMSASQPEKVLAEIEERLVSVDPGLVGSSRSAVPYHPDCPRFSAGSPVWQRTLGDAGF